MKLLARIFGYVVTVDDSHDVFTHYALTLTEAMQWASCYSAEWGVVHIHQRGRFVAARW
jgi:hypothetical protein